MAELSNSAGCARVTQIWSAEAATALGIPADQIEAAAARGTWPMYAMEKLNSEGPPLFFTEGEWLAFLEGTRKGEFDKFGK
jgi:hypothetical protein